MAQRKSLPVEVTLDDRSMHQIEALYRASKAVAGGQLSKSMRKHMRRGMLPAVRAAKSAARSLPVRGVGQGAGGSMGVTRRSTGLRRRMARNITAQVRLTGDPQLKVRLPRAKMVVPYGQESLPQHGNRYGWWRHPVFGDTRVWVRQDMPGWRGWFDTTMREVAPVIEQNLRTVITDMERNLRV